MRLHAVVCAALLLLAGGAPGVYAQSIERVEQAPAGGPAREAAAPAEPFAMLPSPPPAAPQGDADLSLLNLRPEAADDFFTDLVLVQAASGLVREAHALVRLVTTYQGEHFSLLVDPLRPRCTLRFRFGGEREAGTQRL